MANLIKMRIQIRRDTWENWQVYKDIIPAVGEPCFITDRNILKIGDGTTTFENLKPINGVQFVADGNALVLEDGVLKLNGFNEAEEGAQLVKGKDGAIQWVVPSTETVDGLKTIIGTLQTEVDTLKTNVETLQGDVTSLLDIVGSTESGSGTLLSRVEGLEKEIDTLIHGITPDDDKINTIKELIEYIDSHGEVAADIAADIQDLKGLIGETPVNDQILSIVNESEKKAKAVYEHIKYEITNVPVGTLVDYRDKEIRIMVPSNAQFVKQNVGEGGDANSYYCTFRTYAPNDSVVGYIEHLNGETDKNVLTNFSTDEYGRRYQPTWLALAKYDASAGVWNYYGKNSSTKKYLGYDYQIDWYDADGIVVASDKIRINLSNEDCHYAIEPFYMTNVVREVAVNGTLIDILDGRADITVPEFKSSNEIEINEDRTLSIKSINFDKIVQTEDYEIVLNGGRAAG